MRAIHLPFLAAAVLGLGACTGDVVEGTEPGHCTDGIDNDEDGTFDCEDAGCSASPDCEGYDPSGGGDGAGTGDGAGDDGSGTGDEGTGGGTGDDGTGGGTGDDGTGGGTGDDGTGGGTGDDGTGGDGTGPYDGGYISLTQGTELTVTHPVFGTDVCNGDFWVIIEDSVITRGQIENCPLTGDLAAFGRVDTPISGTVDADGNVSGVLDTFGEVPFAATVDGTTFTGSVDATFTYEGETITVTGDLAAFR